MTCANLEIISTRRSIRKSGWLRMLATSSDTTRIVEEQCVSSGVAADARVRFRRANKTHRSRSTALTSPYCNDLVDGAWCETTKIGSCANNRGRTRSRGFAGPSRPLIRQIRSLPPRTRRPNRLLPFEFARAQFVGWKWGRKAVGPLAGKPCPRY